MQGTKNPSPSSVTEQKSLWGRMLAMTPAKKRRKVYILEKLILDNKLSFEGNSVVFAARPV